MSLIPTSLWCSNILAKHGMSGVQVLVDWLCGLVTVTEILRSVGTETSLFTKSSCWAMTLIQITLRIFLGMIHSDDYLISASSSQLQSQFLLIFERFRKFIILNDKTDGTKYFPHRIFLKKVIKRKWIICYITFFFTVFSKSFIVVQHKSISPLLGEDIKSEKSFLFNIKALQMLF
jgi:hypothetical protein